MKKYINFALISLVATVVTSCVDVSKIEVRGVKEVIISSVDANGIEAKVGIDVKNGLGSKVGLSAIDGDIMSGDKIMAHITLTDKVFAQPNWHGVVPVPVRIRVASLSLVDMASVFMGGNNFRFKGHARLRLGAVGRTVKFDEKVSMNEVRKILNI